MHRLGLALVAGSVVVPALRGQDYAELNLVRNPYSYYTSLVELRAGAIGTRANDDSPEAKATGLDSEVSWDAAAYWRAEKFLGPNGVLDFYAGRDGIFAALGDGAGTGDDTRVRLELKARPFQFYRDGFYRDDSYVMRGQYEGSDYEGYLGFGRDIGDSLFVEIGGFYRRLNLSPSSFTQPGFLVPGDYDAYGARLFVEQRNVELDRRRGLPIRGFVLSLGGEREWNDSRGPVGSADFELPSAVWRARGRLEWYLPWTDDLTVEFFLNGQYTDELDRVYNYEAWKPQGNLWGDGQVRLRFHLGNRITLAPFLQGQYLRILQEDGGSADKKTFYGGGAEVWFNISDSVAANAWYSYLNNESRPPIKVNEDIHGEHMFFVGMVLRFGTPRR